MIWLYVLGITTIVVLMIIFEWSKLIEVKERVSFTLLTAFGYIMSLVLLWSPELPGPTQLVEIIYKPFGQILEK